MTESIPHNGHIAQSSLGVYSTTSLDGYVFRQYTQVQFPFCPSIRERFRFIHSL